MASKNKLLGSGKVDEEQVVKEAETFEPVWMYHKDFPAGKIIKTQEEMGICIKNEWVDHPGKCVYLVGHEQLFEGAAVIEENLEESNGLTITVGSAEVAEKKVSKKKVK